MEVPITQFRKQIYTLASRALEGEPITIAYKGKRLRVVPEVQEIDPATRFDKLTKLEIVNPEFPDIMEDAGMKAEMQAEWEKDWKEQGLL
jgi:antitoxin (DNA-binding transcriptional repressor) of toxin-antitoxin stability system